MSNCEDNYIARIKQMEDKLENVRDEYKEAYNIITQMKISENNYIEEISYLKKNLAMLNDKLNTERSEFKETYCLIKQNVEDFIEENNKLKKENSILIHKIKELIDIEDTK